LRKSRSDRRRVIYIYPPRQNTLMKYIIWGMHEYDDIFSDSLYSFRNKISSTNLFGKIARFDYARDLYTVKVDVRDYGHSINPDILLPKVEDIVSKRDPALFAFLRYLITRNVYLLDGNVVHAGMGGLPGVPMSCFFNNIYLMELDSAMSKRAVLYSRYADDIAIFTRTRAEAEAALAETHAIISRLGLSSMTIKRRSSNQVEASSFWEYKSKIAI
ncbi:MAG: reverse transcriptase domain-containing protein, partial [Coriobacteriia bacterium]|nr:reverse transcriptase domain-containing protein [Coriobacteriia bacterium]